MKTNIAVSLMALWLANSVCVAQPAQPPPTSLGGANPVATPPGRPGGGHSPEASRNLEMRKFNLDFGGGTPRQLIEAVEQATGEPLNAIIPEEDKDVQLPALKMRQVMVDDLFLAMEQGSRRTETKLTGYYVPSIGGESRAQYSQFDASIGFRKVGGVWVFTNKKPVVAPDLVQSRTRFYQLTPYLGQNTVEDITTAIKTAWSLMTKNNLAANRSGVGTELKFHKETGLLIAVGDPKEVQVIDDVLNALRPDLAPKPRPAVKPFNPNDPVKN